MIVPFVDPLEQAVALRDGVVGDDDVGHLVAAPEDHRRVLLERPAGHGEHAVEQGHLLHAPARGLGHDGRLAALRTRQLALGARHDDDGRRVVRAEGGVAVPSQLPDELVEVLSRHS
jgi:hypothetical protein